MKQLAILTFAVILPTSASAQSIWMHNRSEMLLETNGSGDMIISYLTPREGLSAQPGDFVVQGALDLKTRSAGGIARVFSSKCGPAGYEVGGDISEDKRTITLTGAAPVRDANCKITRRRTDKLVFTYVRERGTIEPSFIGEWSANQKTCDENEAQEGPILTKITPRGMGFYEEYCAFSQIRGNANQATISMTCSIMDTRSSVVKGLRLVTPRVMEIETRDGPSAGAKQNLYKCPINLKDPTADPSTPSNLKEAEEEYFNNASLKAQEDEKFTRYNEPRPAGQGRR
jgi:hypothetical protein